MEIWFVVLAVLVWMIIVPAVGVSVRRARLSRKGHRIFYHDGYMQEELAALRTQTQEMPHFKYSVRKTRSHAGL